MVVTIFLAIIFTNLNIPKRISKLIKREIIKQRTKFALHDKLLNPPTRILAGKPFTNPNAFSNQQYVTDISFSNEFEAKIVRLLSKHIPAPLIHIIQSGILRGGVPISGVNTMTGMLNVSQFCFEAPVLEKDREFGSLETVAGVPEHSEVADLGSFVLALDTNNVVWKGEKKDDAVANAVVDDENETSSDEDDGDAETEKRKQAVAQQRKCKLWVTLE